ncbi:MAG: hypothetical protein LUG16_00730, partial [Candidatus Gastranaerophilales bacterium]|nr:hypothetical protein [Candidatus Gastranaerophilales bacterium]
VISNLGVKNVIVVHGKDGMDEASLVSETYISEGRNGIIKDYLITPDDFGLKRCKRDDIQGGNALENARIIKNIFNGQEQGAKKDIVILNSGLAFYTFGKTNSIKNGIELAKIIIDSGLALDKLNKYIQISNGE